MRSAAPASGGIELTNWNDFRSPNEWLAAGWRVVAEGKLLQSGSLTAADLAIAPRAAKTVKIPLDPSLAKPGVESFVEVSLRLKSATPWAEAGHEIAWEQFALPVTPVSKSSAQAEHPALKLQQDERRIVVSGTGFPAGFDAASGLLVSLEQGDSELLKSPPRLAVWRKAHES